MIYIYVYIYMHTKRSAGAGSDTRPVLSYLPTPPLGQDMTQGQFVSGV